MLQNGIDRNTVMKMTGVTEDDLARSFFWVKDSRRYKNFDDYLILEKDFDKLPPALPLPVSADYHEYITSRMTLLHPCLKRSMPWLPLVNPTHCLV
jgi:hypothetical protein